MESVSLRMILFTGFQMTCQLMRESLFNMYTYYELTDSKYFQFQHREGNLLIIVATFAGFKTLISRINFNIESKTRFYLTFQMYLNW